MPNEKSYYMGGVMLSCGYSVLYAQAIQTIVLAVLGTLVSYLVSRLMKRWDERKEK
ncbi:hypothetical protein H1R17_01590 [Flavobacterium sp. xlx-214]|uniref:hypothetical protein n=1 Tax=unclassified Flavobacterium TaxID=196869 RepID=UPI0013D0FE64|nr:MULTISPECIES: hypothetical protein [unclassified Flavobacterium]MBA5792714.1 hypothetical protein [Flavobacterium sp. xlx-221]QMI83857.1 hypothetical protein H1R17_01590 [Flavobacterium sp. xlx-214]